MKRIFLAILAVLLFSMSGCASVPEGDKMYITCFDVGQADSFLIQCGGETMLMDTGTQSDGIAVAAEMTKMGVKHIDYLMITHFDKDHVGGAAQIIREFDVETVLRPTYMKESEEVTAYLDAMLDKADSVTESTITDATTIQLGNAEMIIHPAQQELYEKDPSNNSSLVTEIFHGENSLLFAGDVEKERIEGLLQEDFAWDYDFLKVPHHGKHEKILAEFFDKIGAESSLITCSNKNPEEAETLAVLDKIGTKYFLTKHGPVLIESDGERLRINQ